MNIKEYTFNWQAFIRNYVAAKALPVKADLLTRAGLQITLKYMSAIYASNLTLGNGSNDSQIVVTYIVTSPTQGTGNSSVTLSLPTTGQEIATAIKTDLISFALIAYGQTIAPGFAIVVEAEADLIASTAPSSYQTIVSQTGTAAPAVSGSLAPASTYPASTTFTWARTGAGVYTLTASAAVFNTSGKTGVFISQLNNLNASVRGVVTSSTVITVTTAVQSVAILGLLGLTTTNTDALLANTMIYVQTYA